VPRAGLALAALALYLLLAGAVGAFGRFSEKSRPGPLPFFVTRIRRILPRRNHPELAAKEAA
jgi:hypothetical protein